MYNFAMQQLDVIKTKRDFIASILKWIYGIYSHSAFSL